MLTKAPKRIIASFQNAEKPKTTDNEIIIRTEPFQIMFFGEQLLRYIRKASTVIKSSRRKTKDFRSFPPISFVFRPLTPPYVPFGIRRFLIFSAFEHSSPAGRGNRLCEGYRCWPLAALCRCQRLPNIPCSHYPTYKPSTA